MTDTDRSDEPDQPDELEPEVASDPRDHDAPVIETADDADRESATDTAVASDDGPLAPRHVKVDKPDRVRSAVEWVAVIVGALIVALVVKTFLFQAFFIPSESMEPTLGTDDRVLVNKLSYELGDVSRGDVIVFELPADKVGPDGIKDLIKRVVGLPGDVIESRDGVVYVNDRRLEEPYLADGMITGDPNDPRNPAIERQTVPDDHVFVLGDNRSNSADSRYSYRGPIPIDTIVGRAFVLVWPPNKIGWL
ncbi:MAG: signal peptidase I [Acidimicrobiales bacterium]